MKVLAVFIDGLKVDSLRYMPFLKSFKNNRRIKTELGYSVTCHASMYSGVFPNKHEIWFSVYREPKLSPYRWLRKSGLDYIPDLDIIKYMAYKATSILNKNNSFHGVPYYRSTNFRNWSELALSEDKFWTDENYLDLYPSIFDIFRKNGIQFDCTGMIRGLSLFKSKIVKEYQFSESSQWNYAFIGDLDPLSHLYGQESIECISRMKYIDNLIREKYEEMITKYGHVNLICWSDHGHTEVNNYIDIRKLFQVSSKNLANYFYVVDSTDVRFWPQDTNQANEIRQIMGNLGPVGSFLENEDLIRYNIDINGKDYGGLIYYLDPPHIFSNPYSPFLYLREYKHNVSMHGFRPEISDMDGIFVTDKEIAKVGHITLQDIFVSSIDLLGLEIPDYVDGQTIWKK